MVAQHRRAACAGLAHKLCLRLDDGSLIGDSSLLRSDPSDSIVRVGAAKAYELGKLGHEHVLRMEALVLRMESLYHGDSWVEQDSYGSGKRKLAPFPEQPNGGLKRLRSGNAAVPAGHEPQVAPGRHAGSPSTASQMSWGVGEFEGKCKEIVQTILADYGKDAEVFAKPVNPKLVKDYYKIIKKPMDLGTIMGKLTRHEYRSPTEFYDDVMLVWSNCATYNPKGTVVHLLGLRGEALFLKLWASSGLCASSRGRRQNAGVAAEKYEPQLLQPPQKKASTGLKAPRGAPSKPSKSKQGGRGTMDRLPSIASVRHKPPMSREQMEALAGILGELEGAALEGAIRLMRENGSLSGQGGEEEIELDFDSLDPATMWRLHAWVEQATGRSVGPADTGVTNTGAAPPADGTGSESDSESESE